MEKRDSLTKALAVLGVILIWVPLIAPAFFSVIALGSGSGFRFDWLMPAELFPVALIGGALLLWAATRARAFRALIGWSLGVAVVILVGGQSLAIVTGIASGATEPAGWFMYLIFGSIAIYTLALIVMGVGGLLLARAAFKR